MEVYETANGLSPEQREVALFWADEPGNTATPPGHSISMTSQLLRDRDVGLDVAAETYLRVGLAVGDGFIACWNAKYRYNLLRPITYIRQWIDPAWVSPLTTPPFPEYTSGHSVQSGAWAQVVTELFGEVAFTDHTHDERGFEPRSFSSFREAAEEAAISRLYGGIHFRPAIEVGLHQGTCVGQAVGALPLRG
jgi:PAP2 superfamily